MKEFKKFFYVGAISTLFDYMIYSIFIYIGSNYIFSIIVGYSVGFIINYILVRSYVFEKRKISNSKIEFSLIFLITIIGLALNILVVNLLHNIIGLNLYISRLLSIGIVFIYNYFIRKGFIYG